MPAVQVPRAHSPWFGRPAGRHDTLSAMEAARQGTFVVVHRYLGIAVGVPFSLRRVRFEVAETGLFADDERSPLQGVVRYRLIGEKKSGTDLGSMSFTGTLTLNDEPALEMSGDIVFMPGADYDMLRAHQRARKPLSPTARRRCRRAWTSRASAAGTSATSWSVSRPRAATGSSSRWSRTGGTRPSSTTTTTTCQGRSPANSNSPCA